MSGKAVGSVEPAGELPSAKRRKKSKNKFKLATAELPARPVAPPAAAQLHATEGAAVKKKKNKQQLAQQQREAGQDANDTVAAQPDAPAAAPPRQRQQAAAVPPPPSRFATAAHGGKKDKKGKGEALVAVAYQLHVTIACVLLLACWLSCTAPPVPAPPTSHPHPHPHPHPTRRRPAGADAGTAAGRPLPLAERGTVHQRRRGGAGHGAVAAGADGAIPRGCVLMLRFQMKGGVVLCSVGSWHCSVAGCLCVVERPTTSSRVVFWGEVLGGSVSRLPLPACHSHPSSPTRCSSRLPGADAQLAGAAGGPGHPLAAGAARGLGGGRPGLRRCQDCSHSAAGAGMGVGRFFHGVSVGAQVACSVVAEAVVVV